MDGEMDEHMDGEIEGRIDGEIEGDLGESPDSFNPGKVTEFTKDPSK